MQTLRAATEYLPKKQKVMEKSCIWNFKPIENENSIPKSWEEFCKMYPKATGEFYIHANSTIWRNISKEKRDKISDANLLPDTATAEAILALCKLIQLRNAYNGDWVPDWNDGEEIKYGIEFDKSKICAYERRIVSASPLYFKTKKLRDEFLRCFRPLIEKLKPLYCII